eukprot:m.198826 g.198826  ORF g.198826 m.198826 type:complete len:1054 (+) comp13690_c0_seq8:26-3187(+)
MFSGSFQKRTKSVFGTPLKKKKNSLQGDSFSISRHLNASNTQQESERHGQGQGKAHGSGNLVVACVPSEFQLKTPIAIVLANNGKSRCVVYENEGGNGCELVFWSLDVANGMVFDDDILTQRNIAILPSQFSFNALVATDGGSVYFLEKVTHSGDDMMSTQLSLKQDVKIVCVLDNEGICSIVTSDGQWFDVFIGDGTLSCRKLAQTQEGVSMFSGLGSWLTWSSAPNKTVYSAVLTPLRSNSLLVTTAQGVELWTSTDQKKFKIDEWNILDEGSAFRSRLDAIDHVGDYEMVCSCVVDVEDKRFMTVGVLMVAFPVVQSVEFFLGTFRVLFNEGNRVDDIHITRLNISEQFTDDKAIHRKKRLFGFVDDVFVVADDHKGTVHTISGSVSGDAEVQPTIIPSIRSQVIVGCVDDSGEKIMSLCIQHYGEAQNWCLCRHSPMPRTRPLNMFTSNTLSNTTMQIGVSERNTSTYTPVLSKSVLHGRETGRDSNAQPQTLRAAVVLFLNEGVAVPYDITDDEVMLLSTEIVDGASHDPRWGERQHTDRDSSVIMEQLKRKQVQHEALVAYLCCDEVRGWEIIATSTQAQLNHRNELLSVCQYLRKIQTEGTFNLMGKVIDPLGLSSEQFYSKVSTVMETVLIQLNAEGSIQSLSVASSCQETAIEFRSKNIARYEDASVLAEMWSSSDDARALFKELFQTALNLKTKQGLEFAQYFAEMTLVGLKYRADVGTEEELKEFLTESRDICSNLATFGGAKQAIAVSGKLEDYETAVRLAHEYDVEELLRSIVQSGSTAEEKRVINNKLSEATAKYYVETKKFHSRLLEQSLVDPNIEKSLSAQPELQWLHFIEKDNYVDAFAGLSSLAHKEKFSKKKMLKASLAKLCAVASDDIEEETTAGVDAILYETKLLSLIPSDLRASKHCLKEVCPTSVLVEMCREQAEAFRNSSLFNEAVELARVFCKFLIEKERVNESVFKADADNENTDNTIKSVVVSTLSAFMSYSLDDSGDEEMQLQDCCLKRALSHSDLSTSGRMWVVDLIGTEQSQRLRDMMDTNTL